MERAAVVTLEPRGGFSMAAYGCVHWVVRMCKMKCKMVGPSCDSVKLCVK